MKKFLFTFLHQCYFKLKTKNLNIGKNTMIFRSCKLGFENSFGSNTIISNTNIDSYSYFGSFCSIHYARIGKFCSPK